MRKVAGAKAYLQRAKDEHGVNEAIVWFSGGKDSIACLILASEVFDRVAAVYMFTVDGLKSAETLGKAVCKKYGAELHKIPHNVLAIYLKHNVYTPERNARAEEIPVLRQGHFDRYARKITGMEWVITGQRKADSLQRRGMITKCNGVDPKSKKIYPIADWSNRDVYAFLRHHKIPAPVQLDRDGNERKNSGFDLTNATLRRLRDEYPEDYKKVLEVFPFAHAGLAREEMFGN